MNKNQLREVEQQAINLLGKEILSNKKDYSHIQVIPYSIDSLKVITGEFVYYNSYKDKITKEHIDKLPLFQHGKLVSIPDMGNKLNPEYIELFLKLSIEEMLRKYTMKIVELEFYGANKEDIKCYMAAKTSANYDNKLFSLNVKIETKEVYCARL